MQFNPNLYEMSINYESNINYGYDVNYMIYNYLVYFQLNQQTRIRRICPKNIIMKKLKERWNVSSNWQLTIIFIVFAITGSTAAYLSKPVLQLP